MKLEQLYSKFDEPEIINCAWACKKVVGFKAEVILLHITKHCHEFES